MQALLFLLVLVGLGDRVEGLYPPMGMKILGLLAAATCTGMILVSIYVCGNTLYSRLIIGPQGRYWVPLLPLLLLPLYNKGLSIAVHPRLLLALVASASTAILLVAIASIIRRYYYPVHFQLYWSPVALAAALVLFGTMMTLAWKRYAAA